MQIAKIISGSIIGLFSLFTMIQMAGEESGAGLIGAFIGFLLIGGLAVWLIYSGIKGKNKYGENPKNIVSNNGNHSYQSGQNNNPTNQNTASQKQNSSFGYAGGHNNSGNNDIQAAKNEGDGYKEGNLYN